MESKVMVNLNWHREVVIAIKHDIPDDVREPDQDVRDRMVHMFLNEAAPQLLVRDGFAQVRLVYDDKGHRFFEIKPIHPIEMPKYIDLINENAGKFKTSDEPQMDQLPVAGQQQQQVLKKADDWAVQNLTHDLYKKWHEEMFGFPPRKEKSSQGE